MDIFSLNFNSFLTFARDCKLVTKACPGSAFELIWVQVNIELQESNKEADRFNSRVGMVRSEFLHAIVRIALTTYVATGHESNPTKAVNRVLDTIQANAPPEATQDSNDFRRKFCYVEHTDLQLRKHRSTLEAIYTIYSKTNTNTHDVLQSARTMSIGEWLTLCEHLGLFEIDQLSSFGAKMIFMWSRIRSARDLTAVSRSKLRCLFFEDCALSHILPLPALLLLL